MGISGAHDTQQTDVICLQKNGYTHSDRNLIFKQQIIIHEIKNVTTRFFEPRAPNIFSYVKAQFCLSQFFVGVVYEIYHKRLLTLKAHFTLSLFSFAFVLSLNVFTSGGSQAFSRFVLNQKTSFSIFAHTNVKLK